MSTADSYRSYAADCVRQAETARSAEEKNVFLNMALAWIRLAHQKQAIADKAAHAPADLDALNEPSGETGAIDAKAALPAQAAAAQPAPPAP